MITAARSSVTGTGPSASTRPTSWRLFRCGESCGRRRARALRGRRCARGRASAAASRNVVGRLTVLRGEVGRRRPSSAPGSRRRRSRPWPAPRTLVGDVALDDLNPVVPRFVTQLGGIPDEATDLIARVQQLGHEPAADVAGRAGHEDPTDRLARASDGLGMPRVSGRRGAETSRSRICSCDQLVEADVVGSQCGPVTTRRR